MSYIKERLTYPLRQYDHRRHKLEQYLDDETATLTQKFQAGKVPTWVVQKWNYTAGLIDNVLEASDELHGVMVNVFREVTNEKNRVGALRRRIEDLEEENRRIRALARGRVDFSILSYMKQSDFRTYNL